MPAIRLDHRGVDSVVRPYKAADVIGGGTQTANDIGGFLQTGEILPPG
jgi:hypothetical protein